MVEAKCGSCKSFRIFLVILIEEKNKLKKPKNKSRKKLYDYNLHSLIIHKS